MTAPIFLISSDIREKYHAEYDELEQQEGLEPAVSPREQDVHRDAPEVKLYVVRDDSR